MKRFPLLLGVSLGLNGALFALFFAGYAERSAVVPASAPAAVPSASVATAARSDAAPGPETWTAVQAGSIAAQVARLRAEGFPPAVVRAIISAQIRAGFADRYAALRGLATASNAPLWQPAARNPEYQAAANALDRDVDAAILAALGPDTDSPYHAYQRAQFPYLPADKVDRLLEIQTRYQKAQSDLLTGLSGGATRAEREKLQGLEKSQRDEIVATLTPQELEDFDLRNSLTADTLRLRADTFHFTEAEFRALYRLEADFRAANPIQSQAELQAKGQVDAAREAQRLHDENLKALFTPERYAEYERASDPNYSNTVRLMNRLGLPPETANDLYAVQKDMAARFEPLRRMSPAERAAQLVPLAAEAESRVAAILDPRALAAYKEYGGTWLRTFTAPAR